MGWQQEREWFGIWKVAEEYETVFHEVTKKRIGISFLFLENQMRNLSRRKKSTYD
jgi:hypothetical protein